MDFFKL